MRARELNAARVSCSALGAARDDSACSWRAWFPDLQIPDGLTFDDLKVAAVLIRAWQDDEESTAIPLAARLVEHFRAAVAKNSEKC